jgi:catechol 2,3-dioxygenase-like lactoylglutathione lyase family enzyme
MQLSMLDHINIQTPELEATCRFYEDVFGLKRGFRPDFPFPGAWLYLNEKAVVHLIGLEKGGAAATGSGAIHHVAFSADGAQEFLTRLSAMNAKYLVRDVPGLDQRQVFVTDPNGILVEVSFEGVISNSGGEHLAPLTLSDTAV